MSNRKCILWRANHYDGRLGAWQACLGFKPNGPFGGNEYIELVHKRELDIANETIERLLIQLQDNLIDKEAS